MDGCPCGSELSFEVCCAPVIGGSRQAETAEALMRARYCAYATGQTSFLGESLTESQREDFSEEDTRRWAESSDWLGLEIVRTGQGTVDDDEGEVEFIARFKEKKGGEARAHHERALFRKVDGAWYYDGYIVGKGQTVRRDSPKIGRNDLCPCGSGKKYKKCCGT